MLYGHSKAALRLSPIAACDLAAQTVGPSLPRTVAPGLTPPHLPQDWANPCHIYPGTGLAPGEEAHSLAWQDAPAVGGGAAIQMLQMPLLLWVLENTTLSYVSAAWPVQVSLARICPTGGQRPCAIPAK